MSDGSVSLVAQRDIAAGEDITLCYTNPFHGEDGIGIARTTKGRKEGRKEGSDLPSFLPSDGKMDGESYSLRQTTLN